MGFAMMDGAYLHGCSTIIFLYESSVATFGHIDSLGKALLFEVTDGIIVGIRNEIFDASLCRSVLEQVH